MLANIFKSNQPIVIVLIVIVGLLLWIYSFIDPVSMSIPSDNLGMPLYEFISSRLVYNSSISIGITLFLVLIQAFLLVQFNKRYIVINYRTYLPALFYILIASSFVQLQRLNPVIFGNIFIFFSLFFIFGTYRTDYTLNKLYIAGFFVSIASLFWAPFAIIFLLIWISISILRPFIGREWIVGVLGFLTPYLFVFVYYFVFLEPEQLKLLINTFAENFGFIKNFYHIHYSYYIFYGFLTIVILFASYVIVSNFQKKKIKARKFFEINWWLFFIGLLMFIFLKNVKYEIVYFIGVPISFLLTDYFYSSKRNWYLNSILFILFASVIYIQIIAHY